jgi:hypothetical protein
LSEARRTLPKRHAILALAFAIVGGDAVAADRFVSNAGNDAANDCLASATSCRTITHTLTQAASGDTLKLAGGTYAETALTFDTTLTLTLSGGWTGDFTSRDPASDPAIAQATDIAITAGVGETIDLTLDGVTVVREGNDGALSAHANGGTVALAFVNGSVLGTKANGTPSTVGMFVDASGGGVANLALGNCRFEGHQRFAAWVQAENGGTVTADVSDCLFRRSGLAMFFEASGTGVLTADLQNSTVTRNRQRSPFNEGSGFQFLATHTATLTGQVSNCTLTKNRTTPPEAAGRGGALHVESRNAATLDLTVSNTAILGNTVRHNGGGIYVNGESSETLALSLVNTTVSGNRARLRGGGMYIVGNPFQPDVDNLDVDLVNTILWGNRASEGSDLFVELTDNPTVNADHSDIGESEMPVGSFNDLGGNIDADPLLVQPRRDAHLRPGSPAIDAGTCTGAPADDFDGDTRPSGADCDIGADEFVP